LEQAALFALPRDSLEDEEVDGDVEGDGTEDKGDRMSITPAAQVSGEAGSEEQPEVQQLEEIARPTRPVKKELLNPRHVARPPASHATRLVVLVKLHEESTMLNNLMRKHAEPSKKALILSEDELVTMALHEEEMMAENNFSAYPNIINHQISNLTKMTQHDWEEHVIHYLRSEGMKADETELQGLENREAVGDDQQTSSFNRWPSWQPQHSQQPSVNQWPPSQPQLLQQSPPPFYQPQQLPLPLYHSQQPLPTALPRTADLPPWACRATCAEYCPTVYTTAGFR
jgi:hypothetical protein